MIYSRVYGKRLFNFKVVLLFSFVTLFRCDKVIPIASNYEHAQIEIGEDNITYIDGEPFFPIGMFHVYIWGGYDFLARDYDTFDEVFSDIKDGGFNTIHTYQSDHTDFRFPEFLQKAAQYGLQLIIPPNTSNEHFNTLAVDVYPGNMNSPSLLSWYLADEPDYTGISPQVIREFHDIIKEVDPYHLTSVVISNSDFYMDYMNVSDIFMIEPYSTDPTWVSYHIEMAYEAMISAGLNKPLWVILQAIGYQDEDNQAWGAVREPTYEEERCMTYLSIVHGAKGIFYYCFGAPGTPGSGSSSYFIPNSPQHWQDLKSIARELEQLTPVLVSPDDVGEHIEVNSLAIHFLLKDFQGRKYLFAVNSENQEVTGTFSGFYHETEQPESDTLTVLFEDREVFISEGAFSDQFDPYGVHIYAQKD